VLQTRARPLGIDVIVGDHQTFGFDQHDKRAESSDHFCLQFLGTLQYPASDGTISTGVLYAAGALVTVAADLEPVSATTTRGIWSYCRG